MTVMTAMTVQNSLRVHSRSRSYFDPISTPRRFAAANAALSTA